MFISTKCPVCGVESEVPFEPCASCEEMMIPSRGLSKHYQPCSLCSSDLAGSDDPCFECREKVYEPNLKSVVALGPWMGPLREWLSQLKYGGDSRLAGWLGRRLFELWFANWPGIPVVPVPPRKGKIRREGRDTVGLLWKELVEKGVPVKTILRRTDKTPQKSRSRKERLEGDGLHFAYSAKERPPGECVLLDDVTTTGATLSQCAGVLKNVGTTRVYALVVCRD